MRKYVNLFLFWSLMAMLITGIVLFIMPLGRVAYWTGWTLLGLDKDQWQSLHIVFGILMLIFGFWHLYLNWRPFVKYVKEKLSPANPAVITTLVSLVLLVMAVKYIPPINYLLEFQEKIKNSWVKPTTPPPVPHAELMPLRDIAMRLGMRPRDAVELLRQHGLEVPSGQISLKEVAKLNGKRPSEVYQILIQASQNRK
ncbi:DUF4405 domain-containing protein [Thermodesulfatator indicus]